MADATYFRSGAGGSFLGFAALQRGRCAISHMHPTAQDAGHPHPVRRLLSVLLLFCCGWAGASLPHDSLAAHLDCTALATNNWRTDFLYVGLARKRIRRDYSGQAGSWTLTNETHYVCAGRDVIQERDTNNVPLVTYTRGFSLLARTDSNGTLFYHLDGNNNVTALVDANGTRKAHYTYDSYGNLIEKSGPMADANLYRFASREVHPLSGLYSYLYRFYDPNLQRWLNQDPIGLRGGRNVFAFVGNNPISNVDPYGLWGIAFGNNSGSSYFNFGIGNPSVYFSPDSVPLPQAVGDIGRFATGIGSRQRNYGPDDQIVKDLETSPGIMQQEANAISMLNGLKAQRGPCPDPKQRNPFNYSLLRAGYGKAAWDLLDIAFLTDNANTAALGGYGGYYTIQDVDFANGTATLAFHVNNDMGLASASRSPDSGNSLFGNNPLGNQGPLSTVHEHFGFTQTIIFGK